MSEQSPVNAVELNADQALGMVSFGLMQRLAKEGAGGAALAGNRRGQRR